MDSANSRNSGSLQIDHDTWTLRYAQQCIPVYTGELYQFGARVYVASGQPTLVNAGVDLRLYSDASCQQSLEIGFSTGVGSEGSVDPVQPDQWQEHSREVPLNGVGSVVFWLVSAGTQGPGSITVLMDDAFLVNVERIFSDGSESGMLDGWSSSSP
jgi:hypothetical protein